MMHPGLTPLLLSVNKHHIGGIVAIAVGALALVFAVIQLTRKAAGVALIAVAGVVVLVLGVLIYAHKI